MKYLLIAILIVGIECQFKANVEYKCAYNNYGYKVSSSGYHSNNQSFYYSGYTNCYDGYCPDTIIWKYETDYFSINNTYPGHILQKNNNGYIMTMSKSLICDISFLQIINETYINYNVDVRLHYELLSNNDTKMINDSIMAPLACLTYGNMLISAILENIIYNDNTIYSFDMYQCIPAVSNNADLMVSAESYTCSR